MMRSAPPALPRHKYLDPVAAGRLRRRVEEEETVALARGNRRRLRNAVFARFLLDSGCRVSEACGVRLDDLTLDGPRAYVTVMGKGARPRDVTVSGELRRLLRRYLDARRAAGETLSGDSPLFAARGRTMGRCSAWRAWKALLRSCGMDAPGRGCHAARHTRATLLYAETRDLRLVARELGHSDTRMTMRYADALDEDRAKAAEAVERRFQTQQKDDETKP